MDRNKRLGLALFLASVVAFSFYFIGSPFLSQQPTGDNLFASPNQNPQNIATLEDDVDSCSSTPTSDCDQEMLQIKQFCQQSNDQNIPVCSDHRVQSYIDQRGLERPSVNIGN
jgi:hypothetical protein